VTLSEVSNLIFNELTILNEIINYDKLIKDEETINLRIEDVHMIVDLGKIKQLLLVVKSYSRYMKIINPVSQIEK
jgi:hypothetical protein